MIYICLDKVSNKMKAPSGSIITEILSNVDTAKKLMVEVIIGDKSDRGEVISFNDDANNKYTIQKIGFYSTTPKNR